MNSKHKSISAVSRTSWTGMHSRNWYFFDLTFFRLWVAWVRLLVLHAGITPNLISSLLSCASFYLTTLGVEDVRCMWSVTVTHSHAIGLLWTSDRALQRPLPAATRNTHKRQTPMPQAGCYPANPASERPQAYASDRAANGMDTWCTVPNITLFTHCYLLYHA